MKRKFPIAKENSQENNEINLKFSLIRALLKKEKKNICPASFSRFKCPELIGLIQFGKND